VPFYDCGVIHGDPHLGNYTVRDDHSVNLLDYGCVRMFSGAFVKGVIDLYRALQTDDEALAVAAYEGWGFKDLTREMIDVLNLWANYLYAPLLDDRDRRIQDSSGGEYGHEVATKVHGELRRLGGVRPPREFVFVDRAAIGLGSVFLHLNAEVNWHRLFEGLIEDFDAAALDRRQAAELKAAGLDRL
jgi:predicted unusual protein kinase regulating ubiquinone biosynthesis (AarF/ABC1/UbiB family)